MSHPRRLARAASLILALGAAYGCTGGLSCGTSAGCANDYAFPQTQATVPNGTSFVDDGVRLRLTQNALDFLAANIRPILASALGSDPNNPDNILISTLTPFSAGAISLAEGA